MDLNLAGRTAYVTGGAQGIGAAIADVLVSEGVRVAVSDLDGDLLRSRAADWTTPSGDAVLIEADLSVAEQVERAAAEASASLGTTPDILVNNVGVAPNKAFPDLTDADWHRSFELNFMSAVRTSRAIVPAMASRGSGAVVSISSDLAKQPEAVPADYGAFKTALLSWSKSMATEYAPAGVRVNAVCPGPIMTGLWDRPGGVLDNLQEVYGVSSREETMETFMVEKRLMLGMGAPEDVGRLVTYLVSPAARFITASVFDVNGGSVRSLG